VPSVTPKQEAVLAGQKNVAVQILGLFSVAEHIDPQEEHTREGNTEKLPNIKANRTQLEQMTHPGCPQFL